MIDRGASGGVVDRATERIGRAAAWLLLAMALLQGGLVLMRAVFSLGDVAAQEAVVYLHGVALLVGVVYAAGLDAHVRVDVLRDRQSDRGRAWTDLLTALCLTLPTAALIAWAAWPNVTLSWATLEGSTEPGGLPAAFLLKSTILVFAALLALSAVASARRSALRLASGRTAAAPRR